MPPLNQSYEIMQTSDAMLPCSGAPPKKFHEKKRVLFADDVVAQIQEIPHRLDFTEEEKSSLWMTPFEWFRTRHENRNIVISVLNGHVMDLDEDATVRGLESYFPDIVLERRQNIQVSRMVVLRTQDQWRQQGNTKADDADVKCLARLYFSASAKSKESALTRGILDSAYS
jgi:hypothetical protein